MSKAALCQCTRCFKYLARNRDPNSESRHKHECAECLPKGIPLAQLRGTLVDPKMIELLALLAEECAEVTQRIMKIFRWGWDADFEGTTQRHKLEVELGDILASLKLLDHNGVLRYEDVLEKAEAKLNKFREDAAGPKQRLLHAEVP